MSNKNETTAAPVDVRAVMDAYSVPGQICCGMPVGGGYDENGNGEPPTCCGQTFTERDMQEARAAVAELIEAAKKVAPSDCYERETDNVGVFGCCGVLTYKPHAEDCWLLRLRRALARVGGVE